MLTPKTWQILSTVALLVAIVAFLVAGLELTSLVWIALLVSGIAFAVEQVLAARARRGASH